MSKELEKSIKWLSNVNNFKNVSRYSKEYFEHFNKVVKALEQAQKQEKLLELYKELSKYVCEQCYAHELPEITRLKIIIKESE